MKTMAVIGGGLFGRTVAATMATHGWHVTVYDDARPEGASKCAGCLFKPSWLAGIDGWKSGVALLDRLYGVSQVDFKVFHLNRVQPFSVLQDTRYEVHTETVYKINYKTRDIYTTGGKTIRPPDAIYLATGIWTDLIPSNKRPDLVGRKGATMYFDQNATPVFRVWAPYKQSIAVPIDYDGHTITWFGDGTAIKPENWSYRHTERLNDHAREAGLNMRKFIETRAGVRPMFKDKMGYWRGLGNNIYVGTGGGKNGIVLASVFARQTAEALGVQL